VDRKYLTWAKYLTQFQMAQFVTNMIQEPPPILRFPPPPKKENIYIRGGGLFAQSSYNILFDGPYDQALVRIYLTKQINATPVWSPKKRRCVSCSST
jgi:hypothetical protein